MCPPFFFYYFMWALIDHSFLFFFYVPTGQAYDRHCEDDCLWSSRADARYKLDRQSYSAYHHLLTLITCSNTLFSFLMCDHMKEKRSSSCDKIRQEMNPQVGPEGHHVHFFFLYIMCLQAQEKRKWWTWSTCGSLVCNEWKSMLAIGSELRLYCFRQHDFIH